MAFYAFWTLSALSAVALGAAGPRDRPLASFVSLGCGLVVGSFAVLNGWTPGVAALAGIVIVLLLIQLARPQVFLIVQFGAGLIAVQTAGPLMSNEVATLPGLLVGAAIATLSAWLHVRDATFAPAHVREEALLIVLALAIAFGAAPEIHAGWTSALALNANGSTSPAGTPIPPWALGALAIVIGAGCLSRFWRRS